MATKAQRAELQYRTTPVYFMLKDLTTGVLNTFAGPSGYELDPKIEEVVQKGGNKIGLEVTNFSFQKGESPEIKITLPAADPMVIEQVTQRQFERGSENSFLPFIQYLEPGQVGRIAPATSAGQYGFGVLADPTGTAGSVYVRGKSLVLTQVPFAGFVGSLAASFTYAIGANSEILFSDDLIGFEVTVGIPFSLTNKLILGEKGLPLYSLFLGLINIRNEVTLIRAASAQKIPGGTVNSGGNAVDLSYRLLGGGGCVSYGMTLSELLTFC